MEFKEWQTVLYNGELTFIGNIYGDGTCRIANPDWDWDEGAECVRMGEEYNVPYWITVDVLELLPIEKPILKDPDEMGPISLSHQPPSTFNGLDLNYLVNDEWKPQKP